MSRGTVFHIALFMLLCIFLLSPESFPALFEPFTRNGLPSVYTRNSLLALTLNHLAIAGAATVAASVTAVLLGIAVTRSWGRDFLALARSVANAGQTFPPVAVLALAVPVFGFGAIPVLIALFLYGILPVLENTIAGLDEIDPQVIDAANGMGMTPARRLLRVELPLALPVILSGIRISAIIAIATATIGSTVAASTLGEVILAGLLAGNTAYVLQGGIVVAILSILINAIFLRLEEWFSVARAQE